MKLARDILASALVAAIYVLVLCVGFRVSAQDAKVELLTPEETAQAKSAFDNLLKAQNDLAALKRRIAAKHLSAGPNDSYAHCIGSAPADGHVKSGWGCGEFDFSADFKAIVPHSAPSVSFGTNSCGFGIVPASQDSR